MRDASVLRDILRVDHAGEAGAIRIYGAQIAVARWRAPALVPMLEAFRADERRHRALFGAALRAHGHRPCRLIRFWGIGGTVLGSVTAVLGVEAILACTEAVERTVHTHMREQIAWLAVRDAPLADMLADIRQEEVAHLAAAHGARSRGGRAVLMVDAVVAAATGVLIWVSTYGASARMARAVNG